MLSIRWADARAIRRRRKAMDSLSSGEFRAIGNRVVNRTGDTARTQVRSALTKQTGLPRSTIVKAVRVTRSTQATLVYTMRARGGDVALKFFKPRETRRGVSAAPFGQRRIFPGTFMRGGRFPDRSGLVMQGHVVKRIGPSRFPIAVEQSGVVIPDEMVRGPTRAAFDRTVWSVMPRRMDHELRRLLGK